MTKHTLWMILGCVVPLLLIFLAPAFGLGGNVPLFILILAMFAFHLLMPMHHKGHGQQDHERGTTNTDTHEAHQH
ncbi:MAG: hypothetical protein KF843_02135 [Flavobacteriales bacterium]|nr:hypothetical protein [Flavobacteriales bacterium]